MSNNKKAKFNTLEDIENGLRSSRPDVRAAALKVCANRGIPLNIIKRWRTDSDWFI